MGLPQQEVTQRFISFYGTTDKTNQGNTALNPVETLACQSIAVRAVNCILRMTELL